MSNCLIAIDAGTTTSRAWMIENRALVASASAPIGVRDTAREGHSGRLYAGIRDLVLAVRSQHTSSPTLIAAAGMITSSLGLREVPHQVAPAGVAELAAGGIELHLPEISDLPIILFPGVRSGAWFQDEDVESTDLMRGEETLCLGLAKHRSGEPLSVLNIGSHWKAIQVDRAGRIVGSWTTLSGEMLHAVMTETILSSAVPAGRPETIDEEWRVRGAEMTRRYGLSRALFTVRLWEVQAGGRVTAQQRLSFLVGAFVSEGLDAFRKAGYLSCGPVLLIGSGGIAEAWQAALMEAGIEVERVSDDIIPQRFVEGIQQLIVARTAGKST